MAITIQLHMSITLQVQQHNVRVIGGAKISDTATVAKLIPAIVDLLKLPTADPSGRPMVYHLSYNERQLSADETLASADVQEGGTLTIGTELSLERRYYTNSSEE